MNRDHFLYFTTLICGMAIMSVEICTARYLAPFYGASMITWTIIIGVIMTALSIGNIIGGLIADSPAARDRMYHLIWIASIWIAVIPFIGKYVVSVSSLLLVFVFPEQIITAGVFFSCCVLFSIPCIILGTATPCLIRLGIKDLDHSGRIAGELYAVSTIGSIIGTILPTFAAIPFMGTAKTFMLFGALLCGVSLIYFLKRNIKRKRMMTAFLLMTGFMLYPMNFSYAFWKDTLVEEESAYNYLQVHRNADTLILSTHVEVGRQSILRPGLLLTGSYYDYALASPFFKPGWSVDEPLKVLIIGFGAGTYAKLCKIHFKNALIDGVEIDSRIIDLGCRYFDLKPEDAKIFTEDGRSFLLRQAPQTYDVIFLDAFQDVTIPFHLGTSEFFRLAKERLREGGSLVVNINMKTRTNDTMVDSIARTVNSAFAKVWKYDVPNFASSVIFASDDPKARTTFLDNIRKLPTDHVLATIMNKVAENLDDVFGAGPVFSDDLSCIEIISHEVMSDLVRKNIKALMVSLILAVHKS